VSPPNGSAAGENINVSANITGSNPIKTIRVYFNNSLLQEFNGNFGNNYALNWSFAPQNMTEQNILEVEAVDQNNLSGRTGVVVYPQG
jgi:hypothetical protein